MALAFRAPPTEEPKDDCRGLLYAYPRGAGRNPKAGLAPSRAATGNPVLQGHPVTGPAIRPSCVLRRSPEPLQVAGQEGDNARTRLFAGYACVASPLMTFSVVPMLGAFALPPVVIFPPCHLCFSLQSVFCSWLVLL